MTALNAWVEQQLAVSQGPTAWLLLVVGGMAASALPCVYPLYPITVGILRGRTSSLGAFGHPGAYYAGLTAMYATLGAVATATGGAFNALLRLPAVNLSIGAALVVMALATAGALHLDWFQQSRQSSGSDDGAAPSLGATFAMGAGAGLMSSACVGPVVVSVLVGLAASAEAATPGVVALGATKMALFGAGVGLPILLIGVFGVGLPRAGRWMQWVQWVFAGLIAAFAAGYLEKGLVGAGIAEGGVAGVLVAAVVFAFAVFAWQSAEHYTVHERTRRALLAVAGVVAVLAMARVALPGVGTNASAGVVSTSAAAPGGAAELTAMTGNLTWHLDRERAYAEAARTGKPVFIDFYGSWCTNCKAFEERALSDERLNEALANAVLLKIYDTSPLFDTYRNDERFPELRVGLPFFVITNSSGELLYKTSDFTKTEEMALFLAL